MICFIGIFHVLPCNHLGIFWFSHEMIQWIKPNTRMPPPIFPKHSILCGRHWMLHPLDVFSPSKVLLFMWGFLYPTSCLCKLGNLFLTSIGNNAYGSILHFMHRLLAYGNHPPVLNNPECQEQAVTQAEVRKNYKLLNAVTWENVQHEDLPD